MSSSFVDADIHGVRALLTTSVAGGDIEVKICWK